MTWWAFLRLVTIGAAPNYTSVQTTVSSANL
jgi:hypothetical protein